jgi:hypothetical protein
MRATHGHLVLWLLGVVLAPAAAHAAGAPPQAPVTQGEDQPQPASVRRPYRGIFGAPPDPSSRQALTLTASVFAAYDDDVFAASDPTNPVFVGGRNSGGYYGGLSAGADYSVSRERVSLGIAANAGLNRYNAQKTTSPIYSTSGNLAVKLAARTTLSTSASLVYAPQYRLGLFTSPTTLTGSADAFATVAPDYDLFDLAAYRTSASVALSQAVGRRSSLEGWYAMTNVNYTKSSRDYFSDNGGASFRHGLTRNLSLRLGYSYSAARYEADSTSRPRRLHNIDAGVEYSRALSFSRRTKFSFATGSTVLVGDNIYSTSSNRYTYRLNGNANLTHELGRTWTAGLAYRRGVDFREGFNDPFLSDAVSASLGGLFSRRLRFTSAIDYTLGTVGVATGNDFHSATANAGLEFGLTRTLALYGRYVYYAYDFTSQIPLDPRLPRKLDRQGVRVGLTMALPVIR